MIDLVQREKKLNQLLFVDDTALVPDSAEQHQSVRGDAGERI